MVQKQSVKEKGQGGVEYALTLALISLVIIVVPGALYNTILTRFGKALCEGGSNGRVKYECTINDMPTAIFNGSASYDPDGSISAYSWNFGDGSSSTGSTTSHTYTTSGTRRRVTFGKLACLCYI